jgi:hypothetical protein
MFRRFSDNNCDNSEKYVNLIEFAPVTFVYKKIGNSSRINLILCWKHMLVFSIKRLPSTATFVSGYSW